MRSLTVLLLLLGFGTALLAQDETAISLYNSGLEKSKASEFMAAIDLFEQSIAKADTTKELEAKTMRLAKKNGARAAYKQGSALRKEKKYDEAMTYFEKGIAFDANYYLNYLGKAQALDKSGKIDESIPLYLESAKMAQEGGSAKTANSAFGVVESKIKNASIKKQFDSALAYGEAYMEAKGEEKISSRFHFYYGKAIKEKGNTEAALEHADVAIELIPEGEDKSKYFYFKGECHQALGQKAEALAAFKQVGAGNYKKAADYQIGQLSNK